jgi:hypothetical protein
MATLTSPTRPLCPQPGCKALRKYVPAHATDIRRSFRRARLLQHLQQAAAHLSEWVDCPACGGSPDLDEAGKPYTCYVCWNTGEITRAHQIEREAREQLEYEEYANRRGSLCPAHDYDSDIPF